MAAPSRNLVNAERIDKAYGVRHLLRGVSLGVGTSERVGIVGRNGDGKTTLLRLLARVDEPDAGRVVHVRGLQVGLLGQHDAFPPGSTVRSVVLGERADHEWAADATTREVVVRLLDGLDLDRRVGELSGGERRRSSLAALLLQQVDLLMLDEPTNHLDVEAIDWVARHLANRASALLVVTHDRWLLDAVCTTTWEVHDGVVDAYDGGYAAFTLARAERARQAEAGDERRRNLLRKELAWLRRGPPARTSKPRFRTEAASALIADEPPPRDAIALRRFAVSRLGKDVLDIENTDVTRGGRTLLEKVTWRLGAGDRVGLVGVNGAGKTTVLRLLAAELRPDHGRVRTGKTVSLAHLPQAVTEVDTPERVLESVEKIRRLAQTASGREVSASSLLERFGFIGERLTARIGDLSGGERRRLQLLRLLLREPNVLLLDEPTNDLDIDTLTVLEDYLDGWPGTLVVVSHDRYFLERVCDSVWALLGDGSLRMLPGGVEEYLTRHRRLVDERDRLSVQAAGPSAASRTSDAGGQRAAAKDLARLDRQLARLSGREARLHEQMAMHASDYQKLVEFERELHELHAERDALELAWLEAAGR